ncbi:MAG: TIGR04086 family membrane protein [Clostridia bacterium]|nr:TIGR04086 family membrane protein [Clostridia bacterium]
MSTQGRRCKYSPIWGTARPLLVGILAAFAVTLALVAVFSLFFLIIEKVADSAIMPLALLSAAVGCFVGAYCCAMLTRKNGFMLGAIIGMAVFLIVWLIGMFCSDSIFGTNNAIKVILLTGVGGIGGYLGCGRKPRR